MKNGTIVSNSVIGTGKIGNKELDVREGAGNQYKKIGYMSPGSRVEVLEERNGWYKIKFLNTTGYIDKIGVVLNGQESEVKVLSKGLIGNENVDVRNGYGSAYEKIGYMSPGSRIEVLEVKNGWYKIKFLNGVGYIPESGVNTSSMTPKLNIADQIKDIGMISLDTVNVVDNPQSNKKIGYMSKGSYVEILKEIDNYYEIKFLDGIGYIPQNTIKLYNPINIGSIINNTEDVKNSSTSLGEKIGYMSRGSHVDILHVRNNHYAIRFLDGIGYIPVNTVKFFGIENTGKINVEEVDVRYGRGNQYRKIGYMSKGSRVQILLERDGWYTFKFLDGIGYIPSNTVMLD